MKCVSRYIDYGDRQTVTTGFLANKCLFNMRSGRYILDKIYESY